MAARPSDNCFLGLDFGTGSVRAVVVDRRGRVIGSAVNCYESGQVLPGSETARKCFKEPLPATFALQDPFDWLISAWTVTRKATEAIDAEVIAGIGVDFTSCTVLPCWMGEGEPMSLVCSYEPHAWPKLWKHHGALDQAARINEMARRRGEKWLDRYGGAVGLEWFFPKVLEVIECAPEVAADAELWVEAGDWLVWNLVGGWSGAAQTASLVRSTCQAGYKACWSADDGYPSEDFLRAVHPELANVLKNKMPGRLLAPGMKAGELCEAVAKNWGLRPGIPISTAIIDAHAAVPGAGVAEPGTLVLVLGTSGCHMMMSETERLIPGVAGVVKDGILPGFYGYETGQAAMGDAFEFVRRITGNSPFAELEREAAGASPGSDGLLCIDWFNGCRTPRMDGALTGGFTGMKLAHTRGHLYRATLEGVAYGTRLIVDTLRNGGVPVNKFVATGGLVRNSPLFMKILASALDAEITLAGAEHGSAQGAAILGALAAGSKNGGFDDPHEAVAAMAGPASEVGPSSVVSPDHAWSRVYDQGYPEYLARADQMARYGPL